MTRSCPIPPVPSQLWSSSESRGVWGPRFMHSPSGLSCVLAGVEGLLACAAWRVTLPPLAVTLGSTLRIQWGWGQHKVGRPEPQTCG